MKSSVIIKFVHACETDKAVSDYVGRVTGLIDAENFFKLVSVLDIESNPRKPKESGVTREIQDSLETTPELFHLKTKGILVSASSCESLERNRYRLNFESSEFAIPGILDGGHNTFAIAKYLLSYCLGSSELKNIKDWESLIQSWKENIPALEELFANREQNSGFKFLIPLEMIFPRYPEDAEALAFWGDSHRDVTHARNNNVQLTDSTKDNHQGFYDYLKKILPSNISSKVEWKTNDGGVIKAQDIIALALIPLSRLPLEIIGTEINVVKIYNSKQQCVDVYRKILEKDGNGLFKGQTFELTNPMIMQALDLLPQIIKAYDYIYKTFPEAYNKSGGSFGRISGVRIYDPTHSHDQKYSKRPFATVFSGDECNYSYGPGFIVPIVVGLRELIVLDQSDNKLHWKYDPIKFIDVNFQKILGMFNAIIRATNWDPQKIGKDKGSYEIVSGAIQISASTYKSLV